MSVVDINHQTDFSGSILIEARQLRPLVDMARQAGVGIGPILADLGLPADLWASRPDAMAPLAIYYRLRNLLSAAMGDETCKLSSRPLMPGSADFILSHLDGAKTLKDAMKQVADYYNLLHGGEYNSVRRRGDAVLLVTDDRDFPYRRRDDLEHVRFAMECVQIYLYGTLSMLAPSAVTGLKSVAVTRPRGGGLGAGQLGFWTAPVRYGASVYALEFDSEAALAPIVLPPAEMLTAREVYEHVLNMVEARGRDGRVGPSAAAAVREKMRQGIADQRRIARLLETSVATLRRRLSEEGTSFRALKKEILNGAAQDLLRRRRPIADVAEELGFSDFRSFNRAFKEWNGVTPRAYVERLAEAPRL